MGLARWRGDMARAVVALIVAVVVVLMLSPDVQAARLDQMSLDRWKKLREVERYQLKIAEKYYGEKKWKVAAAEYEKYLTLYEDSEGAPYSQLKWSLCQRQLRKLNTAIKEGFQSVLDYWPESPEAIASMYFIGQTYKNMGEIRKAKKAYREVMTTYPEHLVTVYSINDLIAIATTQKDTKTRVELWNTLAYKVKRTRETSSICRDASKNLGSYHFYMVAFDDGVKALATTWKKGDLTSQVVAHLHSPIRSYTGDDKQRVRGVKLADLGVAYVKKSIPAERATPEEKGAVRQHYYWICDLYESSRRDKQVETTYAEIEKLFGGDDDVLGRLAGFYRRQGRYDDARKCYSRYGNKIAGNSGIAETYYSQKMIEPCVLAYRRNIPLDAKNPTKWHATIAGTYRAVGQYDKAIAIYEQLLKTDVENTQTWIWQIATAYRDGGKNKEAIGYFRQSNNFPSNYSEMAMCHRRLKQYKEAVILYNQIIGGSPGSAPWALLQIGYTRESAGQKEQAIKTFQQVCKRFPKKSEASRAHAHLQNKYKISVTLGGSKKDN